MKIKTLVLSVATAATGVGLLVGPAGWRPPPRGPPLPNSSYGFDGNAHLVVGGGSTTLYKIAQGFARSGTRWRVASPTCHRGPCRHAPVLPRDGPGRSTSAPGRCLPTYNGVNAAGNFERRLLSPGRWGRGRVSTAQRLRRRRRQLRLRGHQPDLTTLYDPNPSICHLRGGPHGHRMTLTNGLDHFTDALAVATDVGEPVTSRASGFPAGHGRLRGQRDGHHFGKVHRYDRQHWQRHLPQCGRLPASGQPAEQRLRDPGLRHLFAGPKPTKGNRALAVLAAPTTSWPVTPSGASADGVQVFSFDSTDGTFGNPASRTDIFNIWECNFTTLGQLPEYSTLPTRLRRLPRSCPGR